MTRLWTILAAPIGIVVVVVPASAQVDGDLIVQPAIPQDFNRDRNVSVTERPQPDYSPLGVPLGGFKLYPRIETGAGGTSNTYYTLQDKIASPFLYVQGSARLASSWSRHLLRITATATQRDYIGESRRNENQWSLDAFGRLDVYHSLTIEADAKASRQTENLFSGAVTSTVAALSHYRRNFASLKTTYTQGRLRTFALLDYTNLSYSNAPLLTGDIFDASSRNRHVVRLTGQLEYARSPSVSLFAQLGGARTVYDHDPLSGLPRTNSKEARLLVGTNVDIAGRVRGTIGLGYSIRDYDASVYRPVRGLSVEAQLEAFPTDRLTIGLSSERTIEDSTVGSRAPYWNSEFGLRVDYELLRNCIITATGEYSRQSYLDSSRKNNIYRMGTAARYSVSRRMSLRGAISYSQRSSSNNADLGSANEARIEAGIAYQL
ncbi:hypothetical protein SAMN05518801_11048 [Novosphingobium sp. CF614]|nr:hypothetical protein SAMN05518801_11048 [Novosphingobium sp. CF614]